MTEQHGRLGLCSFLSLPQEESLDSPQKAAANDSQALLRGHCLWKVLTSLKSVKLMVHIVTQM